MSQLDYPEAGGIISYIGVLSAHSRTMCKERKGVKSLIDSSKLLAGL